MELINLLKTKYNETNYIIFSRDFFKDVFSKFKILNISSQFENYIKECKMIAEYLDPNDKKIAILSCKIQNNSNARTIQRNFIAQELTNGDLFDYDAALVAFYDELNSSWKLSFITFDIEYDKKINFVFKPAKRFTFIVGPNEPLKTCIKQLSKIYDSNSKPYLEDIKDAFSLIGITEDFYNDYCKCFDKLSNYLLNNEQFIREANKLGYIDPKEFAITFTKKTLGQIVFLHFVQKKGWLGVPKNEEWGKGDLNFFKNSIKSFNGGNYFNEFLEPLFYKGLNTKRNDDLYGNYKIPFLNGGLFHPIKEYNWLNTDFNIPNSIWFDSNENGFLDILGQYNFTIDESNENEQEIAVDPEMLGKIFESLLDPKERHAKGAHYTPREIVNYLCVESLSRKLSIDLNMNYDSIRNYILYNDALDDQSIIEKYAEIVDDYLSKYTIVDPAVGSGAFLVGMLNVIVNFRMNLGKFIPGYENRTAYDLKKHCIQNNLFGVDIEFDAIEIAKLRLWLSLIVDQKIFNSKSPKPLPNLNFSLRIGNSIVDEYKGIKLWNNRWNTKKVVDDNPYYYQPNIFGTRDLDLIYNQLKLAKSRYFELSDENSKKAALAEIEELQLEFIRESLNDQGEYGLLKEVELMIRHNTKPFFIWPLEFEKIFKENKGFDIVVFNPPYIDSESMSKNMLDIRDYCKGHYDSAKGNWDLFVIFIELALKISNSRSVYSFIVPNKLLSMPYSKTIRDILMNNSIYNIRDYASVNVFKEASVYPITLIGSKVINQDYVIMKIMSELNKIDNINIVKVEELKNSDSWDQFFVIKDSKVKLCLNKILKNSTLAELVDDVKGAATVSEAYLIRQVITEYDTSDKSEDYFKFVNTGTIDPYFNLWDIDKTQYIKGKFFKPVVSKRFLEKNIPSRYYDSKSCKIIIAGMSKRIEAIFDKGDFLAGKSTIIIQSNEKILKFLLGILNSKLMEVYYKVMYNSRRMSGGYFSISPEQIKKIPIPLCSKEQINKVISFVDQLLIDPSNSTLISELDQLILNIYDVSNDEFYLLETSIDEDN